MNTRLPYSITPPSENHLEGLQRLWAEAFGDTANFIRLFFDSAYSPNRCLIAVSGNRVIGALYWFDCEYQGKKLAYLYAIATAKEYRGMGICHNLMATCHKHLNASGYAGVLLVPENKDLYSFYQSLGYEVCSYVREFSCIAEDEKIHLRSLTKEQYAKLRRKFLPADGIIQEGENLEFLQTYAQFYVGSNYPDIFAQVLPAKEPWTDSAHDETNAFFLLTAYRDDSTLHGIELLGAPTAAPHIVHALGCSKGIFRTPGSESPFAMFHPLSDESIKTPLHFGFAFD